MHHQNIQTLVIEMLKFHNGFSKVPFWIFRFISENNFYSLWSQPNSQIEELTLLLTGKESVRYLGQVTWYNSLLKQEVLKLFTYLEQKSENASRQIVHEGYVKPK